MAAKVTDRTPGRAVGYRLLVVADRFRRRLRFARGLPRRVHSPLDSAKVLRKLITERTGAVGALTASSARELWLEFANVQFRTPNEPDADGLLYEYGVFSFSGQPRFHLSLTRQFALPGEDEYWQVQLTLLYEVRAELEALDNYNEWWFVDGDIPLARWAEELRARPEWQVLESLRPVNVEVTGDLT